MLSNYIGKDPVDTCERFDRNAGLKINVEIPASIKVQTKYRSRRWYHRIAFHLFSLAVCNSWIIYGKLGSDKSLVDFLAEICIS